MKARKLFYLNIWRGDTDNLNLAFEKTVDLNFESKGNKLKTKRIENAFMGFPDTWIKDTLLMRL